MKPSKYKILLTVFECGNITKAAEKLYYTQSGISQIISNYEKELGLPLMIRSKNGIQPTECGKRILKPLEQIVKWEQILNDTAQSINGIEEGTLRIGAFSSVSMQWIPFLIKEFSELYPKIQFQMIYGGYDEIEEQIRAGKLDCGFTIERYQTDLTVIPLMSDEFKVVLYPEHKLTHYKEIPPHTLEGEAFIFPSIGAKYGVQPILEENGVTPNIRFKAEDDYTAIAMTELNLGITILPQLILDGAESTVEIRSLTTHPSRSIGIAVHSLQYATPLTRKFLDFTADWVGRNYPVNL